MDTAEPAAFDSFKSICEYTRALSKSLVCLMPRTWTAMGFLKKHTWWSNKMIPVAFKSEQMLDCFVDHIKRSNLYFANLIRLSTSENEHSKLELRVDFSTAFQSAIPALKRDASFTVQASRTASNNTFASTENRLKMVNVHCIERYDTASNITHTYVSESPQEQYYDVEFLCMLIVLCCAWLVDVFENNRWTFKALTLDDIGLPLCLLEPLYLYGAVSTRAMIRRLIRPLSAVVNIPTKQDMYNVEADTTIAVVILSDLFRDMNDAIYSESERRNIDTRRRHGDPFIPFVENIVFRVMRNLANYLSACYVLLETESFGSLFVDEESRQHETKSRSVLEVLWTEISRMNENDSYVAPLSLLSLRGQRMCSAYHHRAKRCTVQQLVGMHCHLFQNLCVLITRYYNSINYSTVKTNHHLRWTGSVCLEPLMSDSDSLYRTTIEMPPFYSSTSFVELRRYEYVFNLLLRRQLGDQTKYFRQYCQRLGITIKQLSNREVEVLSNGASDGKQKRQVAIFVVDHPSPLVMHLIHCLHAKYITSSVQIQQQENISLPRAPLLFKIVELATSKKRSQAHLDAFKLNRDSSSGTPGIETVTFVHYYLALRIIQTYTFEQDNTKKNNGNMNTDLMQITDPEAKSHYQLFPRFIHHWFGGDRMRLLEELDAHYNSVLFFRVGHRSATITPAMNYTKLNSETEMPLIRGLRCFLYADQTHFMDYTTTLYLYDLLDDHVRSALESEECQVSSYAIQLHRYLSPIPSVMKNAKARPIYSKTTVDPKIWLPGRRFVCFAKEAVLAFYQVILTEKTSNGSGDEFIPAKDKRVYLEQMYLKRSIRPAFLSSTIKETWTNIRFRYKRGEDSDGENIEAKLPSWLREYQQFLGDTGETEKQRLEHRRNWVLKQPLLALFIHGMEHIYNNELRTSPTSRSGKRRSIDLPNGSIDDIKFLNRSPHAWSSWFAPDYVHVRQNHNVSVEKLLRWQATQGWSVLFTTHETHQLVGQFSNLELIQRAVMNKSDA